MINRNVIMGALCSVISTSALYAGEMGPVVVQPTNTPFVSAEGGYSWVSSGNFTRNGFSSHSNKGDGSARVAGGIIRPYKNDISFSSEVGWGYFGHHRSKNNNLTGSNYSDNIYGFDLLLGAYYQYNSQFSVYGKAGAMLELINSYQQLDLSKAYPGGLYSGVTRRSYTRSGPLPELKAGGLYRIRDNIDISLAYLYVFGSKVQANTNVTGTSTPAGVASNLWSNTQLPSIGAVLVGLNYYFT